MAVRKRSVTIAGHSTSYSIEDEFQTALKALAEARAVSLAALIAEIDAIKSPASNLSSALRLHVLEAAMHGALESIRKAKSSTG